jgi:hypothetical protein
LDESSDVQSGLELEDTEQNKSIINTDESGDENKEKTGRKKILGCG